MVAVEQILARKEWQALAVHESSGLTPGFLSQPLGFAIGNALEVKEAIDTLQGHGPQDLEELCLALGSQMVYLAGKAASLEEAKTRLQEVIKNGQALAKFKEFLQNQGGNPAVVDHPELLPAARYQIEVPAKQDGVVAGITADAIGAAAMLLGAGRVTKDSKIDLAVGLVLHKKVGDKVKNGESLVTIHANQEDVSEVIEKIYQNIRIADHAEASRLIHEIIGA